MRSQMNIQSIIFNCKKLDVKANNLNDKSFVLLIFKAFPSSFFIDNICFNLKESSFMLINSDSFSRLYSDNSSNSFCADFFSFSDEKNLITNSNIPFSTLINFKKDFSLQSILDSFCFEVARNSNSFKQFSTVALQLVLIKLNEIYDLDAQNSGSANSLPRYDELCRLRRSISQNPFDNWNINDICSELQIGRTYFHRIYFAAFHTTCLQDIINCKLDAAKNMLLNSDDSISSIAEKCGYDNDSYFMRQFKKHIGLTPSAFRKKFR